MYKKILAPLDGSKLSECSLEHIKAIATGCQASEVVLLTVLQQLTISLPEYMDGVKTAGMAKAIAEAEKDAQQKADEYLIGAASNLKKESIAVRTVLIRPKLAEGVAEDILDYAKSNKVDLIIMSTHGRSGVSRWAFGSVTDKVVRYATVPVLIIPPHGCRIS